MSGATRSTHTAPRRSRAEWHADFLPLREQGMTGTAIAARFGIGSGFVYDVLADPEGSQAKARKLRYRGTCIDCGGPTDGGEGREKAPERCQPCRNIYQMTVLKYWTRERVIEAIQRFAREHGRPPHATDWNHSGREPGYPPTTACYRGTASPNAPFRYWADAIEAAGFPRPRVGAYDRSHIDYPSREAGQYALKRARARRRQGITATLIAAERGVSRDAASDLLARLWTRRLLERERQPTGHRGPGHYVYHLSSNGASPCP